MAFTLTTATLSETSTDGEYQQDEFADPFGLDAADSTFDSEEEAMGFWRDFLSNDGTAATKAASWGAIRDLKGEVYTLTDATGRQWNEVVCVMEA